MTLLYRSLCLMALTLVLYLPAPGASAPPDLREGGTSVTPGPTWVNLYSLHATLHGQPLPIGAYVAIFDQGGTQCGEFTVTHVGWYGLAPCYGDDPITAGDEGARSGDVLQFAINGLPANAIPRTLNARPVSPDVIVTWTGGQDLWEVELHAPAASAPAVRISATTSTVHLGWQHLQPEAVWYEVWRSTGTPNFLIGAAGSQRATVVAAPAVLGSAVTWNEGGCVGNAATNCFYRIRALTADRAPVSFSQPAVGEFDYALTPGG